MAPVQAEQNLAFWRGLVGLSPTFPMLDPMSDEDLLKMVVVDEAALTTINSAVASHQLTQIIVERGWGASTLFRYLSLDARDHATGRLTLPVALDFDTFLKDQPVTPDALVLEIRRQIMVGLVRNSWETSQNADFYWDAINFDGNGDLRVHKGDAYRFLELDRRPKSTELVRRFPVLKGSLAEPTKFLLTKMRLQVALYVHLPRSLDSQRIQDLVSAIKWIAQEASDMEYAAWREIYVCDPTIIAELNRDFKRAWHAVEYPKYSPAQIYGMLTLRYQPKLSAPGTTRRLSLTEVFGDRFVDESWPKSKSLSDLFSRVRKAVLARLDCPQSEVPFKLEPRADEVKQSAPPPVSLAERLARRRESVQAEGGQA